MIIVISCLILTVCTLNIICCKVDKWKEPFGSNAKQTSSCRLMPHSKTSFDTNNDAKQKAQGFDRCFAQSYHPMRKKTDAHACSINAYCIHALLMVLVCVWRLRTIIP